MAGARESKRLATHARIAEAGLQLFLAHGYEGTTLDDIAAAAGISRRTFFYYFTSKDDILLTWHGAGMLSSALAPAMREAPPGEEPLTAALHCLIRLASRYESDESLAMDRIIRSSEALRLRKDAAEIQMERHLADVMGEIWPETPGTQLSIAAMMAVGALRIALDDWRSDPSGRPLAQHLTRVAGALPDL